jgi:hypothetical protein
MELDNEDEDDEDSHTLSLINATIDRLDGETDGQYEARVREIRALCEGTYLSHNRVENEENKEDGNINDNSDCFALFSTTNIISSSNINKNNKNKIK